MSYYKAHVFFCTNQRENGKACCGSHCSPKGAEEITHFAKEWVRTRGLKGVGGIRVSSAGCMGRCDEGPVLVVYPQGAWYTYASREDVEEIFDSIVSGRQVKRLLLDS